jgi:gamma-glutamylcyclotransferase (GGCT)/AIG2-like uncharacterized protein YtfP
MVYGTLKKGFGNNRLLEGAKFIKAREFDIKNCRLRANPDSPFPYLYKSNGQRSSPFYGELYEIDEKILADVDRLEGHPVFYKRVFLKEFDCYTYIYEENDAEFLNTIYKFL